MYSNSSKIAILLSTYNGQFYLNELINSIINQSYNNFKLYIRDDGSKDNTLLILSEYQAKYDFIEICNNKNENLGAFKSFMWMLENIDSKYYMFADQDDIWEKNKVEILLKQMLDTEILYYDKPILIHSDVTIVDENINILNTSFWKFSKINQKLFKENINYYGISNCVIGCSMFFNKFVKNICFPINNYAIMHDSWITLCIAYNGGLIIPIDISLVKYRQHNMNVIGVEKVGDIRYFFRKIKKLSNVIKSNYFNYKLYKTFNTVSIFKFFFYKINYLLKR